MVKAEGAENGQGKRGRDLSREEGQRFVKGRGAENGGEYLGFDVCVCYI
jgi:hypothetical protein